MVPPVSQAAGLRHRAAFTAGAEGSTIGAVPFRQIFTVLLALIVVLLAALFVLSWDGDDADDAATPTGSTGTDDPDAPATT